VEIETLAVMIVIIGFVWGGFLFFLVKALRSEKRKRAGAGSSMDRQGTP